MAFLKKSLFLVLFLALVPLSICEAEKREEENEEKQEDDDESEKKRGVVTDLLNTAGGLLGNLVGSLSGGER
uniref:Plasticin-DA1 n=1 Tax=Agalychnis dacnicolor TaxID=75988 RepID=PTC1_AGADC|nr:RecName: Full=Plasticin-DA1; Short=PTC-DA1; AltName: Full=Dermaseptin PD-3-6; Short=DRP-PD3-6; Short=PD36; Flags: Precursor [Agalychnis dacnicolor]CAA06429.1 dermaseptin-related peptide [Agalychnis dacnicolor]